MEKIRVSGRRSAECAFPKRLRQSWRGEMLTKDLKEAQELAKQIGGESVSRQGGVWTNGLRSENSWNVQGIATTRDLV